MAFELLKTVYRRWQQDRREGPQEFNFSIDELVDGHSLYVGGGRHQACIALMVDRNEEGAEYPDYLKKVFFPKYRRGHGVDPVTSEVMDAYEQGHAIRFIGKYSFSFYKIPLPCISWDLFVGQVVVEDKESGEEVTSFDSDILPLPKGRGFQCYAVSP
jgi:hypothetical protein